MTDPIRLRDAGDSELRELLRYTNAVGAPSAARVDALTARVLADLAAPASSLDHRTRPSGARGATLARYAVGALLLVLGFLAYRWLDRAPEQPATRDANMAAPAPAPVSRPTPTELPSAPEPEPLERAPQADAPAAPRAPLRMQSRLPARKPSAIEAPAQAGAPTAEIVILKRARHSLAADPRAALALLAQHQREHPAGVFVEEREALAVEALWRAREDEQAAQRLRALLDTYPRTTYRERLTALLERPR